jgi:hypothetical protein
MISVVGQQFFERLGRPLRAAANARRHIVSVRVCGGGQLRTDTKPRLAGVGSDLVPLGLGKSQNLP